MLVDSWVSQSGSGALITMHLNARTPLVCAVADGMGGHAGGELASRVALGLLAERKPTLAIGSRTSQLD